MRKRLMLAVAAGAAALLAGCGGGDSESSSGGGEVLPWDYGDRCPELDSNPGCGGSPAPEGTTFELTDDDESWTVEYTSGEATREPYDDPANPEQLTVEVTMSYTLDEYSDGEAAIGGAYPSFEASASTDGDGMSECGQEPEEATIAVGESLPVTYCYTATGPPSLIAGPLQATVDASGGGTVYLAVEDAPPSAG